VDPLACTPPSPPERPEVIAQVDLGSDPTTVVVELSYGAGGTGYQGDVRMVYDAGRKVFTFRLPAVTRDALGGTRTPSIGLAVTARNGSGAGADRRPVSALIRIASYCLNG
jgi:hypothetical protein